MALLGFLILFPLVVAGVLLAVRDNRVRNAVVVAAALVIGIASVWLVVSYLGAPWIPFDFHSPVVDYACMVVSVLVAAAILFYGIRHKNAAACALAAVQVAGSLVFEFAFAHGLPVAHVEGKGDGRVLHVQPKRFDKFPCRRFEAFRRPRDQGYLVAFPRQFFRRRPADAAASARDQRYGYVRHDEPPG